MATQLIDAGRVQVRSVGGTPGQAAKMPGVSYVGYEAKAQAAGTLAKSLDSMVNYAFDMAAKNRQAEAQQDYMAQYQINDDMLEKAKNGDMSAVNLGNDFSVYGQTLKKMRSFELSGRFEQEIRSLAGQLQTEAEENGLRAEDVHQKISSAISGYTSVIGGMDADAALKFQNSSGIHAALAVNAAYKAETKRNKEIKQIMVDKDMEAMRPQLQQLIKDGSYVDGAGAVQNSQKLIDLLRDGIRKGSFFAGGAQYAQEKVKEFDAMVLDYAKRTTSDFVREHQDPLKAYEMVRKGFTGNIAIDSLLNSKDKLDIVLQAKNDANDWMALQAFNATNDQRLSKELQAEYADKLSRNDVRGMRSVLSRLRGVDPVKYADLLKETDDFQVGIAYFAKYDSQLIVDQLERKFNNPYGAAVTFDDVFNQRKLLTKATYDKFIGQVKSFGDEQVKLMEREVAAKLKMAPGAVLIPDALRKKNEAILYEIRAAFIADRRINQNIDPGLWLKENFEKYKKTATKTHNADLGTRVTNRTIKTLSGFDEAIRKAQKDKNQNDIARLTREKNELKQAIDDKIVDENGQLIKKDEQ